MSIKTSPSTFIDRHAAYAFSPLPRQVLPIPLLTYQPLRSLYSLVWLLQLSVFKLPFWLIFYLLPRFRPHKNWSYLRSLAFSFIKAYFRFSIRTSYYVEPQDRNQLNPIVINQRDQHDGSAELDKIKGRAVWIEPVGGELVTGQLLRWMKDSEATLERNPGYWTGKNRHQQIVRAQKDEKVFYHLHG